MNTEYINRVKQATAVYNKVIADFNDSGKEYNATSHTELTEHIRNTLTNEGLL